MSVLVEHLLAMFQVGTVHAQIDFRHILFLVRLEERVDDNPTLAFVVLVVLGNAFEQRFRFRKVADISRATEQPNVEFVFPLQLRQRHERRAASGDTWIDIDKETNPFRIEKDVDTADRMEEDNNVRRMNIAFVSLFNENSN